MSTIPERVAGAELPATAIFWREDGQYLDLTGFTWEVKVANAGTGAVVRTKTTGITSTAGSATVANVTIAWDTDDTAAMPAGSYKVQVKGTSGGLDRIQVLDLIITPAVA